MAQTIKLKRSSVAGNVPGSSDLSLGEIAVNTADGAVYIKKGNNDIVAVADNDILHIDTTNGRVGIGTKSPDYALDIRDDSNIQLKLSSTTTTNNARITYGINNQQKWNHGVQASDSSFTFYDIVNNLSPFKIEQGAATNTLVVDSNSRVGIGTNNPSEKLDIVSAGSVNMRLNNTGNNVSLSIGAQSSAARITAGSGDRLGLGAGNTQDILNIASDGSVGIGTDSPATNLEISGSAPKLRITDSRSQTFTVGDIMSSIEFDSDDTSGGAGTSSEPRAAINMYAASTFGSSTGLEFRTKSDTTGYPVQQMVIDNTGQVGIGTTSPTDKLEVYGDGADTTIRIHEDAGTHIARLHLRRGSNDAYVENDGGLRIRTESTLTGTAPFNIINNGNVGIGDTTPDFKLSIRTPAIPSGSTYAWPLDLSRTNTDSRGLSFGVGASGGPHAIGAHNGDIGIGQTYGTDSNGLPQFYETLSIVHDGTASVGKVGIGTDNPLDLLHIKSSSTDARLILDAASGADPELKFFEAGNVKYTVGHDAATSKFVIGTTNVDTQKRFTINSSGAITFNEAFTFPTSDGASNEVLQTDGSGNLTFAAVSGSSGVTVSNNANNRVLTGDGTNANAEANLTFDGTTLTTAGIFTLTNGSQTNTVMNLNGSATTYLEKDTGTDFYIANNVSDRDIFFRLNDGGSNVTALALDASEGGNATFAGKLYLSGQSNNYLQHDSDTLRAVTPHGYIQLGPANTGHAHIMTDRSNFYFNVGLQVNSGIIASYDEDLVLQRARSTSYELTLKTTGLELDQGKMHLKSGLYSASNTDVKLRQYYLATGDAGGSFLLGKIENSANSDGAVEGIVRFAYDYGSTSNNCAIHFNFAQRAGTARGTWWYEHDDQEGSSDRVHVRLIDDGAGNMYVWATCVDYAKTYIETTWRQCTSVSDSGTLTAGTLTTGTTLFDTANNPTSEMHIGRLYTHNDIYLPDDKKVNYGSSNDLQIYHDNTDSLIRNYTGDLVIQNEANDKDIIFRSDDGSGGVTPYLTLDGANVQMIASQKLAFSDNVRATFGNSSDLQIYHDTNNSWISDAGTGSLIISGDNVYLRSYGGESKADFITNGAVTLYYDNAAKLATKSDGVDITGNIVSETTSGNHGIKIITGNTAEGFLIFGDAQDNSMGGMSYNNSTNSLDIDCNNGVALSFNSSRNATFAGTLEATSFSDGTISGITFIDEDSFSTNSATKVPTQQSIKAYVDAQVAGVVDSAPGALNTLNELAAALGDDASFSTTTSTALGNRLRVDTASQGLTGTQQANAITNLGITATKTELNYVDGVTSSIQSQLNTKLNSSSAAVTNKLPLAGGTMTGALVGTNATFIANAVAGTNALNILGLNNGNGTGITFSDNGSPAVSASGQNGYLTYYHGDGQSYGSGNAFIFSSSEATTTILADGKLMYKEGIYSKPSTGTGAGTRKDANWDTAYGWGDHASGGYLTSVPNHSAALITSGTLSTARLADTVPFGANGGNGTENTFTTDGGQGADNLTHSTFFRDNAQTFGALGVSITHPTNTNYTLQIVSTSYSNANDLKARVQNNGTWTTPVTLWSSGNSAQFTSALNTKLSGIATGADVTPSWVPSSNPSYLTSSSTAVTNKLPLAGGSMTGALNINVNGDALNLRSTTNAQAVRLTLSSDVPAVQIGHLEYVHSDNVSYGSGEALILGGTEATTTILADGKLMYKEGIYSKPASGTGAGTRKDANWDTAYGWGDHASEGYLTSFDITTQTDSKYLRSDTADTASGILTYSNTQKFLGNTFWQVSSSDTAIQRADARDDATTRARLHWYGQDSSGVNTNFRHAWYDGSSYVNVDVASQVVSFSGGLTSSGDVRADTHFNSTDTNATLSATGSGNVYLRPNGKSSTTGQVHIATSGNATFAGEIHAKDSNSSTDPTITFTGHTTTGLSVTNSGSQDELHFITGGTRRMHLNDAGVTSYGNVYTGTSSEFRNYGGTWKATTGVTGNGFQFINSVDGTAMTISSTGNVVCTGSLSATTKSFDIEHPSKKGMRLHHGVVEGPEHSVYVRGKSKEKVILLPDYWVDLIHEDTITVQLTAIGSGQDLYVEDIKDNKVYVNGDNYFYYIQAERKDIDRFEVEYEG